MPDSIDHRVRLYVDDIAQSVFSRGTKDIVPQAVVAGRMLYSLLRAAGIKISSKTTIVSSYRPDAARAAAILAKEGIRLSYDGAVRDLGVDAAGGSRRSTKVIDKRNVEVKLRLARLKRLRNAAGLQRKHKTRRYANTNLWPAASFGQAAYGLANGPLRRTRVTSAKSVQDKSGQCTFSTLLLGLGLKSDPEVMALKQAVSFWLKAWHQSSVDYQAELRAAWHKKFPSAF